MSEQHVHEWRLLCHPDDPQYDMWSCSCGAVAAIVDPDAIAEQLAVARSEGARAALAFVADNASVAYGETAILCLPGDVANGAGLHHDDEVFAAWQRHEARKGEQP